MCKGRLYTAAYDGTMRIWDATKIKDDEDLEDEENASLNSGS